MHSLNRLWLSLQCLHDVFITRSWPWSRIASLFIIQCHLIAAFSWSLDFLRQDFLIRVMISVKNFLNRFSVMIEMMLRMMKMRMKWSRCRQELLLSSTSFMVGILLLTLVCVVWPSGKASQRNWKWNNQCNCHQLKLNILFKGIHWMMKTSSKLMVSRYGACLLYTNAM